MPADVFDPDVTHPDRFGRIMRPDEQWLAKQAPEAAIDPQLAIVDPHHHLWDYPSYRYLVPEFTQDLSGGHNVVATVYAECLSMYRAAGPEAHQPLGETEFVVGQAAESASGQFGPTRVADKIIGAADFALGAAVEDVLQAHVELGNGRFAGVRLETNWDEDAEIADSPMPSLQRPEALRDPTIRAGLRKLAQMDLVCDSWLFFTQLQEICELADALPELTIVCDHCGGPLGYARHAADREEGYRQWRIAITEVAKRPNVVCKLGGLLARGAAIDYVNADTPPTSDDIADAWRQWIVPCIESFGAQRCMFESNFPLEKMGTSYTVLWNAFKKLADDASPHERHALFAGTAATTYKLELASASHES